MIKKGGYFVVTYVDIIKKWKEKKIDSIEKLDQQLSNFRIIFAYNSGAIENSQITYHDTREIFENGKSSKFFLVILEPFLKSKTKENVTIIWPLKL